MSKPFATTPDRNEAYRDSLPWSLRHSDIPENIVKEARDIAAFLCEATTSPRADDFPPSDTKLGDWNNGLYLCFNLLIDKLDIAAGVYKFPTSTHDRDAPCLCEREGQ